MYHYSWIGQTVSTLISSLVVGIVLWLIGSRAEKKRVKADAIRDLMTYRGDYASPAFRRSLNKVSVIFHDQADIRQDVRLLYETLNDPVATSEKTKRSIVGLIYKLCQKNGFKGLTEYDIDQSFSEKSQTPNAGLDIPISNQNLKIPIRPIVEEKQIEESSSGVTPAK